MRSELDSINRYHDAGDLGKWSGMTRQYELACGRLSVVPVLQTHGWLHRADLETVLSLLLSSPELQLAGSAAAVEAAAAAAVEAPTGTDVSESPSLRSTNNHAPPVSTDDRALPRPLRSRAGPPRTLQQRWPQRGWWCPGTAQLLRTAHSRSRQQRCGGGGSAYLLPPSWRRCTLCCRGGWQTGSLSATRAWRRRCRADAVRCCWHCWSKSHRHTY
jgi:hypothetical protein